MRMCPVCDDVTLDEISLHKQVVDQCPVCHGIYFDRGELESIVGMVSLFNDVTLREQDIDTVGIQEQEKTRCCPADQQSMEKRDFGGHIIDICPDCSGIWLDDREIFLLKLTEQHIKRNLQLYIRLGQ